MCDSPAIAPIVQALVEKSLVVFENGRYHLLETVRAYALRRLRDAGGAADASLRHARFFLSLGPAGPPAIAASEARIHRERDNHGAAMAFWRDRGCSEELGQMVSNAVRVWMYYGQLREGLSWINTMLAAELPPAPRSNWLRAAAGLASAAMETAAASRYFSELLDLARGRSDDSGISHALLGLGALAMWKGDAHAAVEAISEAVAIPERAGDRAAATHLRHYLGSALIGLGDFESARRELLLTLAGARAEGLLEAEAWATLYLGDLAWMRGDFVAAEAHTLDSLGLFTRLGQSYSQSVARGRLALLRSRTGDETGAYQLLVASYDATTPVGLAFAALVQSMVLARRRPATAAALFGAIRSIAELTGIVVPAPWREAHDDALAATREALGQSTFNTACERGALLPLVNVCQAGLHDAQELLGELESASAVSARETEVLSRVAAGATNKEIALDLGISVRTAERHLANSYAKIGARGRADAIAWVLREKGTSAVRP